MDSRYLVPLGLMLAFAGLVAIVIGWKLYKTPARCYRRRLRREDRLYAALMAGRSDK